ncbi:MAG: carotenoid oxygenase family protein [Leptolyngbya sp. IPPAS B-1204]|nr:MAG: hypothetical protein EDM05_19710 [Leptolyngbya sp. IPPAS B-1204]
MLLLTHWASQLQIRKVLAAYIENYNWQPEQGTRFLVIRKSDGKVVHTGESEAVFAFHHVNAFEQDNEIVVDLVAYPNSSVIQSLYLEPLLHHSDQVIACRSIFTVSILIRLRRLGPTCIDRLDESIKR